MGTNPIFLSHVELVWNDGTTAIKIYQKVAAKEMFEQDTASNLPSMVFKKNKDGDGTSLLSKASTEMYKCYLMMFYTNNDPELMQINKYLSQYSSKIAIVILTKASLFYYTTDDSKMHETEFPGVVAFMDLKKKDCS
jgi:hypothetical protein